MTGIQGGSESSPSSYHSLSGCHSWPTLPTIWPVNGWQLPPHPARSTLGAPGGCRKKRWS